jgi:hypothetical protein
MRKLRIHCLCGLRMLSAIGKTTGHQLDSVHGSQRSFT